MSLAGEDTECGLHEQTAGVETQPNSLEFGVEKRKKYHIQYIYIYSIPVMITDTAYLLMCYDNLPPQWGTAD